MMFQYLQQLKKNSRFRLINQKDGDYFKLKCGKKSADAQNWRIEVSTATRKMHIELKHSTFLQLLQSFEFILYHDFSIKLQDTWPSMEKYCGRTLLTSSTWTGDNSVLSGWSCQRGKQQSNLPGWHTCTNWHTSTVLFRFVFCTVFSDL